MGMDVDLDAVHLREHDMVAAEILMSESQERMLAIVAPGDLDEALRVCEKWEVEASVIGKVTASPDLRVVHHGEEVADIPAASLSEDAPLYHRPIEKPSWQDDLGTDEPELPRVVDVPAVLLRLLDDPAIGDRSWIYQQYDHMLFLNTVVEPGHDGSLLRIKGTSKGLAVSTDGDALRCYLDPRWGAERIVYESALNVAVTGAKPYALVDNLNFGNPEKPEVMWQFVQTVEGMASACEALDVPVVGGNVSFYNETDGVDIYPAPVVGMLGFCDPMPSRPPRLDRAEEDMEIWLVGPESGGDFAGSAFARIELGHLGGRPVAPDAESAIRVTRHAARLAHELPVLHDVSTGGIAVALTEICIRSGVGAKIHVDDWRRLFCEGPHRFLAVAPRAVDLDIDDVPVRLLGTIGGDSISFGDLGSLDVARARDTWSQALPRHLR